MFTIRIADLNICIDQKYRHIMRQCCNFATQAPPDFTVSASPEELAHERQFGNFSDGYLESICVYRAIARKLPLYDAAVFHAAVVEVDGRAFAFTAPSGTGKTTHIRLWQEQFGDRLRIINGDKPIVRLIDDTLYAYGTPWQGKESYGCNARARLDGICLIERGTENRIAPLPAPQFLQTLMHQVYVPKDGATIDAALALLEQIVRRVPAYVLHCTPTPDAAALSSATLLTATQRQA